MIIQESYPDNFNFDEFNSIKSYSKKLKYANERLRKISSGSSRVVYQIDNEKVIKIAKNKKGLAQNLVENDWGYQMYDTVAKVFESDEKITNGIGPFWIEMEFAKKVGPRRFRELSGFSPKELWNYLYNNSNDRLDNMYDQKLRIRGDESEWMQNLISMIRDYDLPCPGDLARVNSYGEVLRNNNPKLVLVDFGLTKTVFNDFYKVN